MKCPKCKNDTLIIQEMHSWDKTITFYRPYCTWCDFIGHCYDTEEEAKKENLND